MMDPIIEQLPKVDGKCLNCDGYRLVKIPKHRNGVQGVLCLNCEHVEYETLQFQGHPDYQL